MLDDVEAVCATPPVPPPGAPQLLDQLTSLVEKNLVECTDGPGGETRFRMLETVAEFARAALLASGEQSDFGAAHARHVVELVEQLESRLWGPEQGYCIARLTADRDNIRAALRRLVDDGEFAGVGRLLRRLVYFWWLQGEMAEARRWGEATLAAGRALPPLVQAQAFFAVSGAEVLQGREEALAHVQETRSLARIAGDHWIEGHSLLLEGLLGPLRGDVAGGINLMWQAQQVLREAGDEWGVGHSLTGLSALAVLDGHLDEAECYAEQRAALARKMSDVRSIGQALDDLALVLLLRDDVERAIPILEESIALSWEVGQVELVAYGLMGLAMVAAEARPFARCVCSRPRRRYGRRQASRSGPHAATSTTRYSTGCASGWTRQASLRHVRTGAL
jgi:hypothetical protein